MVGVVGADAVGDGLAGFEEGVLGCVTDGDAFFEGEGGAVAFDFDEGDAGWFDPAECDEGSA